MSNSPRDDTVLVVGATGFIGRKLVSALQLRKNAFCVLARDLSKIRSIWPQSEVIGRSGDITKPQTLKDICTGVHTVFHLASSSEEVPSDETENLHWQVTVEGTRHLLESAVHSGVKRFIYVSSVKAMGEGGESCLDESSPAEPVSSYGRAKLEAERLVLKAGRMHGMHVCNLRLPLVYGRDNRGNIWRMISAIDHGRFPPLPETNNKRSMVHVDDVIQALWLAAEHPATEGKTYIVTDGQIYSTHQIYVAIHKALGRKVPRWTLPIAMFGLAARMGDAIGAIRGRNFVFNSSVMSKLTGSACYKCQRIKMELGYQPTRFLEDGLREMVDEYNKFVSP